MQPTIRSVAPSRTKRGYQIMAAYIDCYRIEEDDRDVDQEQG